jgi:hypothetical protein
MKWGVLNSYVYVFFEFQISELEFQFLDFSTAEFEKNFPTGIVGIKNGIGIPLPMGVPEIGTENWNSQPRPERIDYRFVGCGGINGCNKTQVHWLSLVFAVTTHLYNRWKLMIVVMTSQPSGGMYWPEIIVL